MQKPQVDHLRCFSITTGFHGCWCQKIPDANNLHFLIRLLSSTLHLPVSFVHTSSPFPCHALCWAFLYNWTHCAEALTFNLPACGHMCICAGTTLPANISTARTSKAGTTWARRLPCTRCHMTKGRTGFWRTKWRNYIQVMMTQLRVKSSSLSTYLIDI